MTLVNRVSAFFIAALAVVLATYSAALYAVAQHQLSTQFDEQLHAALHALVASIEVEPEEVKWQASEHTIALGIEDYPDRIRWAVIGDGLQVVDSSRNASPKFIATARTLAEHASPIATPVEAPAYPRWALLEQRLSAPAPVHNERELDEFDEIVVVVGHSKAPLEATMSRLAILVTLLPLSAVVIAAILGRGVCQRALRPVLAMAEHARQSSGADLRARLPVTTSGDELSDLGAAFNTLLGRFQQSFEQQRRFTGDAAHELRTPLTILLGQIDVALRKNRSPAEYRATLGVLRDEAQELHQIVEALLFLARIEAEAALPDAHPVELSQWLPAYLDRWKVHPRRSDVSVDVKAACAVLVSEPLLNHLLDNLVGNALKYSPPGSPVRLQLSRRGAEAVIAVEDRGAGISTGDLESIFDPFFRSQSARGAGVAGTGLGLAIARRIATAFNGRLTCDSTQGQGSRFTFWAPCC